MTELEQCAQLTGLNMTEIVERALEKYIGDVVKDAAEEGEQRLKRVKHSISSKQVSDVAKASRSAASSLAGVPQSQTPKPEADAPTAHKRKPRRAAERASKHRLAAQGEVPSEPKGGK